jgi:hypothetical protein
MNTTRDADKNKLDQRTKQINFQLINTAKSEKKGTDT